MRCEEPGWTRVGPDWRRSLWIRVTPEDAEYLDIDHVESIEFCSGRDGDDAHVRIPRGAAHFIELLTMAATLLHAAECCNEDDEAIAEATRPGRAHPCRAGGCSAPASWCNRHSINHGDEWSLQLAAKDAEITRLREALAAKNTDTRQVTVCPECNGEGTLIVHEDEQVHCDFCNGSGKAIGVTQPKPDPRPTCITCSARWVPPEGVDATQVPCDSCRKNIKEARAAMLEEVLEEMRREAEAWNRHARIRGALPQERAEYRTKRDQYKALVRRLEKRFK